MHGIWEGKIIDQTHAHYCSETTSIPQNCIRQQYQWSSLLTSYGKDESKMLLIKMIGYHTHF